MTGFGRLSIRGKVTVIAMSVSTAALLVSSASLLVYDVETSRVASRDDLGTQAQIIGAATTAAIAFGDSAAATETLSALAAKQDIVAAAIYTPDGRLFARYLPAGSAEAVPPSAPDRPGASFRHGHAEIAQDVRLNDRTIGVIYLHSDLRQQSERLTMGVRVGGIVVLVSLLLALALASGLQRAISGPVRRLREGMSRVSDLKDYSIQVERSSADDIGALVDGFNQMIREVAGRDEALQRANRALVSLNETLESASRAKSTFLANMSHELRTPLNAIIGYAELLEEETLDAGHDQYRADIQKIRVAGRHLLSLINDVLDLSKIEAGKLEPSLETFQVAPMVKDLVSSASALAIRNRNVVEVTAPDTLGTIRSDPTRVRQILYNLLSNAIKFTEDGLVRVDVARERRSGADWMAFRIADTGIGMSPQAMQSLFTDFMQADGSTAKKYGGTGLGLAISRRLSRLLGGSIEVESAEGQGSTFCLLIPVDPHPPQVDLHPAGPDSRGNESARFAGAGQTTCATAQ